MNHQDLYFVVLQQKVLSWDDDRYGRLHSYPGMGQESHSSFKEALESGNEFLFNSKKEAHDFFTYKWDPDARRKREELEKQPIEVKQVLDEEKNILSEFKEKIFSEKIKNRTMDNVHNIYEDREMRAKEKLKSEVEKTVRKEISPLSPQRESQSRGFGV